MDKFSVYAPKLLPREERYITGRRSCKGCGKALAARIASKAMSGSAVLPADYPGASALSAQSYAYDEVTSSAMVEQLLSAAERINAAAARATKSRHKIIKKPVIVIDRRVFMSDFLALSRVLQQQRTGLYLCFDNEPYVDALIKRTLPQPFVRNELAHPVSDTDIQQLISDKNLPDIAAAADFSYFATACPSMPFDYIDKIAKGMDCDGNAFILVLTPCPTGWMFPSAQTHKVGLSAVGTGYFPLYEIDRGGLTVTERLEKRRPVQEYLMQQKRFFVFPPQLVPSVQSAVDTYYEDLLQREQTGKTS